MGFSSFFEDRFGRADAADRADVPDDTASGTCAACPLTSLLPGQIACLDCVHTGKRLKRRLAELGLTPGVEMMVLQNNGGPLLLSVRDSRLALGRSMAAKVEVTPLAPTGNG